ncbi:Trans-enoyl reductase fsdC [Paramyrothecium foliicola]|nr:Trans-enoyl reductase fsdC [Paramyrothecium foliicola]
MAPSSSQSVFLGSDGKLVAKEVSETYTPQDSQALVRVVYSGINPCDINFFYLGMHSYIPGFEHSGTVVQVGPNSPFQVGDAVCGLSPVKFPQPSFFGTHQDLALAEAGLLYKVPLGLSMRDAGGIVMASHTAIDALFNALGFGFPSAAVNGDSPSNHPILIWGGASTVGAAAIQIAKSAGFGPIFATASPKNHETLKRLGATSCFDYRSPTVADEIREAATSQGIVLTTAFDTVGKGTAHIKSVLAEGHDQESLKLVCTLPVQGEPAYKSCWSYRPNGNLDAMGYPQDPELPQRTRKIMEYLLENHERVPTPPLITAVEGVEAVIREAERVARGEASMEKVVVRHPIQG